MTSKVIANNMIGDIDITFPHPNKNNSTQGFRTNYEQIGKISRQLGVEIGDLHTKQISIVGDATGTSGALNSGIVAPTPLNLVLANTGVTAGSYTSTHNELTIGVDSKGRILSFTSVPTPKNPALANTFKITSTTTSTGFVKEFVSPTFTFDEYGILTATNVETHKFGLTGHPLAKGSLIVGKTTAGESAELLVPSISYNPSDIYALAWRPDLGNEFGLAWHKIPPPTPVNPAQVVSILAGEGVSVSADPALPVVGFDFTTFAQYPDNSAIQTGSKILLWDAATNGSYQLPLEKVFTVNPSNNIPYIKAVKEDTAPELGGDLEVGFRVIKSKDITGITLETRNNGPIVLRNVKTVSASSGLPLDPTNYIVSEQKFPLTGPTFTPAETAAGTTTATLKSTASGQMFWDKSPESSSGVRRISAGAGIAMDPIGDITSTGSVKVDYSALPLTPADINSDFLMIQTPGRDLFRNTIASVTFTTPQLLFVDPLYGANNGDSQSGSPAKPFRTIGAAMAAIDEGNPSGKAIMLLPGVYKESFDINRPNVSIMSLAGPAKTIIRGAITIPPGGEAAGPTQGAIHLSGISFDISNMTPELDRIITAYDGIESFYAENCWFYDEFTEQGRPQELISFAGPLLNFVHFDRCKFNGKVVNYLTKPTEEFVDGRVRFTNVLGDYENLLFYVCGTNTMSELNNIDLFGQLDHKGGIVELNNIAGIVGDFSDADWDGVESDDELFLQQKVKDGIVSTASASQADLLILNNVSLRYHISRTYYITSKILKTGNCYYTLSNVNRKTDIDLLTGLRYDAPGCSKVDQSDQVNHFPATSGAKVIDAQFASTWSYELNGNAQFTLKAMETAPNSFANVNQATTLRVSIKQDSTARTVTWSADTGNIVWDGGSAPNTVSLTTGGYGVYEFMRINSVWFAKRIFAS